MTSGEKNFSVDVIPNQPTCPQGDPEIDVPDTANIGEKIDVGFYAGNASYLAYPIDVEVRYAKGETNAVYDSLVSGGGTLIGVKKGLNKCDSVDIGSFTMPDSPVYIVAIIRDTAGNKFPISRIIRTGAFQLIVKPMGITIRAGNSFKIIANERILGDKNKHKFKFEVDTPWGTISTEGEAIEYGYIGYSQKFNVNVPKETPAGNYVIKVKGIVDDKVIGQRNISVIVTSPIRPPTPVPPVPPAPPKPKPPTPPVPPKPPTPEKKSRLGIVAGIAVGVVVGLATLLHRH